jgi:phosphoserine phosphatase
VRIESFATVRDRIQRIRDERPGGVLATDGDGTLWHGDVAEDLFFDVLADGRVREDAKPALERLAHGYHPSPASVSATDLARTLFRAYEAGTFEELLVTEMIAWVLAGHTRAEARSLSAASLERHALRSRLHEEQRAVVEWAQREGIEVYLVSASPRFLIDETAALFGIPTSHVVASSPMWRTPSGSVVERGEHAAEDGDVMVADVVRPIPYADGKVTNLRACIGARPVYAAFGDNAFDVALLRDACVPVAIRPKDRLRARAGEVPDLVELARI